MLVLTRREGEKINVGSDVTIVITRVRGGQVRVGVLAPKGVKILRDELSVENYERPPVRSK